MTWTLDTLVIAGIGWSTINEGRLSLWRFVRRYRRYPMEPLERLAHLFAGAKLQALDEEAWAQVMQVHGKELRQSLSERGRQELDRARTGDGMMSLSSGDSDLVNRQDIVNFMLFFYRHMRGDMQPPLRVELHVWDQERRRPRREPGRMVALIPTSAGASHQEHPGLSLPRHGYQVFRRNGLLIYDYDSQYVTLAETIADCGFTQNFPWNDFYFHWMLQLLPQLKLLKESGEHYDKIVVRVNLPWQRATLTAALKSLGIPEAIVIPPGDFVPKRRIWPGMRRGYVPPFPLPTDLREWLREMFLVDKTPGPKEIYVTRKNAFLRRVVNEDELVKGLQMPVFALEEMSPFEQARLFYGADLIVGPHGGSFTNLVYCRKATNVIEIDLADHLVPFQLMSKELELDYCFFEATCANPTEHWANYHVEVPKLVRFINVIRKKMALHRPPVDPKPVAGRTQTQAS